ncbi:response regulator transcription factor [Paraburkholderia sp.]|uniref:response regulator transcription factor n=1 Tax=Paraburkholderia sp. TaxID=1926495 RepID=UPI0025E47093|nr:response regulator transcription factor [Paraburkholderia sp.]
MRILLVSPPRTQGAWIARSLHEHAHSLKEVPAIDDGIFWAGEETFDAAILVASHEQPMSALCGALPRLAHSMAGRAILAVLDRQAGSPDRSAALRAGADACLCTPVSSIELHERLIAFQRTARYAGASARTAQTADDALASRMLDDAQRAGLTRREFLLLKCLLRQANHPVARDDMIRYVWSGREDVDPSTINRAVSRLRSKLGQRSCVARIETIAGYGYRLRTHGAA